MEAAGIIAIALAGFGFAGVALALGLRNGTLRVEKTRLGNSLVKSELNGKETADEFDRYQLRANAQMEKLIDDVTDLEDLLTTCTDPVIVHSELDRVLQEAARGLRDPRPD